MLTSHTLPNKPKATKIKPRYCKQCSLRLGKGKRAFCSDFCASRFRQLHPKEPKTLKRCQTCNKPMTHNRKYCGKLCRPAKQIARLAEISVSTVGAVSELTVAIQLMNQGFEVYRNLSPNGSADLVIIRNGVNRSIEVRTSNTINGKAYCSKVNRANILAMVIGDKIIFEPPIDI